MSAARAVTEQIVKLASTTYSTQNQLVTMTQQTTPPQTGLPAGGLLVGAYRTLILDFNISAISGTSASATVSIDRYGADGVWYNVYTSGAKTATGATSNTIGLGAETNKPFGDIVRCQVQISNTVTPSVTMTLSLIGKS